jgi:hypothetical protein
MPNTYEGAPLPVNRQPEHRVKVLVDDSGYVVGGIFETGEGHDFIGFMRARRSAVDPSTIEMRDWPVDEHGRGLTLLELDQLRSTYLPPTGEAA